MNARAVFIIAIALAASLPAYGEIYRHTDKNGNVVYTDQPPEDAEPVELQPLNTVPGGQTRNRSDERQRPGAPAAATATAYASLKLSGVAANEMLQNPEGSITLSASADLPLQAQHRLYFIDNGRDISAGDSDTFVIERIERGSHTFAAEIRDASGKVLISSEPVTMQVSRTTAPPAKVRPR